MRARLGAIGLALVVSGCFDDQTPTAGGGMTDSSGGPTTTTTESTTSAGTETTTGTTTTTSAGTTSDPTSGSTTADPATGPTSGATTSDDSSTGETILPVCDLFTDDFNGDEIDSRWILEYPESVSQNAGAMTINITAENGDQFARAMVQPESGLEEGTVWVEVTDPPSVESTQLILYVEADGDARIAFTVNVAAGNISLEVRFTPEGGVQQVPVFSDTYDPINHRWLRIVEMGENLSFQTSPDGVNYSQVYSEPTPFAVDSARVGVVGNNFAVLSGGDSQVSIGEFGIQCGN